MNTEQFLDSLPTPACSANEAIASVFNGTIAINKLIGLDKVAAEDMLPLQEKLCVEEAKEVLEAIDKQDKFNLVKELIDYMVVGGYEDYRRTGTPVYLSNWRSNSVAEAAKEMAITLKHIIKGECDPKYKGHLFEEALDNVMDTFKSLDIDHREAALQVLESNLSKFPTRHELSAALNKEYLGEVGGCEIALQVQLLEEGGRYGGVTCEPVFNENGVERLVFWAATEYGEPKRKYLKAATYKPACMKGVFNG